MLKQLIYSNGIHKMIISCQPELIAKRKKAIRENKEYRTYKLIDIIDIDETMWEFPPEKPRPIFIHRGID